jgi:TonB family protein
MKRCIPIFAIIMLAGHGAVLAQQDTPAQSSAAPEPLRVSRIVMEGQRIASPMPEYPADAKADGIEGTVVLRAVISTTGIVDSTEVVSGPEKLRAAANEAVNNWTYKPYLIDDKPVPVQTTVILNFKLSDASVTTGTPVESAEAAETPAPAPPPAAKAPARARVSAGITAGLILRKTTPEYPANARSLRIQGAVVIHAIISKKGDVVNLSVISGPAELQQAALDAVKQWKYKPYLLNGEPTDIDTMITVNFNLPPEIQHGPTQPHPLGKPY